MPLSRRQRAVLPAMLSGASLEDIARTTRVGLTTLKRWLAQVEFADTLNRLIDEQIENALRENAVALADAGPKAVATIKDILENKGDPEVRLRAANSVLDRLLRLAEYRQKKNADEAERSLA